MDLLINEDSKPATGTKTVLWLALFFSVMCHLILFLVMPSFSSTSLPAPSKKVFKLTPVNTLKVEKPQAVSDDKIKESIAVDSPSLHAISQSVENQPAESHSVIADVATESIAESLRASLQPSIAPVKSFRCTDVQRRQRLIRCDETRGYIDDTPVFPRSLDSALAIAAPPSERAMAINARQVILLRQRLENMALSKPQQASFLRSQLAEDLRLLRRQSDALDQQRSSLKLPGITVDSYRASDSHTRNPNVFNQGRL